MITANPRAMVMPPRPPKTCPISMSRSVRPTSKNVVRKTLIVFLLFYACALAHNPLLLDEGAGTRKPSPYTLLDTRRGSRLFRGPTLEMHGLLLCIAIDNHVIVWQHCAFENLQSQRILNEALNSPAERSRTVSRIVAFAQKQFLRSG